MAQITITEILGSDNMSASRATIQSNFRILADEANKIETYLNTSAEGGQLSVANATITKGNKNVDQEIFVCEASGKFNGNLSVVETLSAASIATNENGSISTGSVDASDISTGSVDTNAIVVNKSDITVDEGVISADGKSFFEISFTTTSGSPSSSPASTPAYSITNLAEGQLFVVAFKGDAVSGELTIGTSLIEVTAETEFDGSTATFIYVNGSALPISAAGVTLEMK